MSKIFAIIAVINNIITILFTIKEIKSLVVLGSLNAFIVWINPTIETIPEINMGSPTSKPELAISVSLVTSIPMITKVNSPITIRVLVNAF